MTHVKIPHLLESIKLSGCYEATRSNMVKVLDFKTSSLERRLGLTKEHVGGFHSTIRRTLLCTRLLGLFPLSGLSSSTSEQLRFTLRSPYTIVYVLSLFGQFLMFVMSFYWVLERKISLKNITNTLFYSSSLAASIILLNIGRYWPQLMVAVESIEATLPPFSRNVARITDATMVFILIAAVVEHLLSVFYGFTIAYSCDGNDVTETYFRINMPWIFDYTSFSLWKGILTEIFNIQSTFIWSFNDLLIMVISIYLTEHVLLHNTSLKRAVNQDHFTALEFRIQNLNVMRLIKLVNGRVGIYILVSFGSNLYWICTQLFNSLNKTQTGHFIACHDTNISNYKTLFGIEHTTYFTFSFSFIVLRTLLVLLLAARIHSNSKVPLVYLYGLPSEKFDVEVERFISQINNMKVALSGLDFFYVTRTMILTVAGTIVTYELVMFQFSSPSPSANSTILPSVLTTVSTTLNQ